jgi:molybdate transport system substrate-binding protein
MVNIMIKKSCKILLLALGLTSYNLVSGAEVTAAVAANFTKTIEEIGQAFTAETGHTIRFAFGPTGKLFAQIKNGAPFDLFFAADEKAPTTAIKQGLALAESYVIYARGVLALYGPGLPVADKQQAILTEADYRFLSIANPRVAPYGEKAVEYMEKIGVYEQLRSKLVNGESIAHAFQYVVTKNAQLGFVALSQLVDPASPVTDSSEYWAIPSSEYSPINQGAVILKRGADNPAAIAFMSYMRSPEALAIIAKYGYE